MRSMARFAHGIAMYSLSIAQFSFFLSPTKGLKGA